MSHENIEEKNIVLLFFSDTFYNEDNFENDIEYFYLGCLYFNLDYVVIFYPDIMWLKHHKTP